MRFNGMVGSKFRTSTVKTIFYTKMRHKSFDNLFSVIIQRFLFEKDFTFISLLKIGNWFSNLFYKFGATNFGEENIR